MKENITRCRIVMLEQIPRQVSSEEETQQLREHQERYLISEIRLTKQRDIVLRLILLSQLAN